VRGPFLLSRLFRYAEGRARYVPWTEVARHDRRRVTLRCGVDDLRTVQDLG
jgi:hypothetical protein